jgi:hypothetical protein
MNPHIDDSMSAAAMRQYVGSVCDANALNELLAIVREFTGDDLPHYTDGLTAAFAEVEPVFARPRYAELLWHCATNVAGYVERVVLTSAAGEAEGSEKLFELWRGVTYDADAEAQILQHATDEARHSRMFVRLTAQAFPRFLPAEASAEHERSLPDITTLPRTKSETNIPEDHLIDHLVQMNIGEIRTRLHMHLLAPIVLALTPDAHAKTVQGIFEALVQDEVRHIAYTASLMERWAGDGAAPLIARLYRGRLRTFNRLTVDHTEHTVRQYGQGRFPDLLEM